MSSSGILSRQTENALTWLAPATDWHKWPQTLQDVDNTDWQKYVYISMPSSVALEVGEATHEFILGKGPIHLRWLNALAFLSRRFLTWTQGGLALRGDPHIVLEAQMLLGRIPFEPLLAFGWIVDIDRFPRHTPNPPSYAQVLRAMSEQALEHIWHQAPMIPTPAWPELEKLKREGLVEPHRHLNGSGLMPTFWLDILREMPRKLRQRKRYELSRLIEATRWVRRTLQARLLLKSWPQGFSPLDLLRSLQTFSINTQYKHLLPPDHDLKKHRTHDNRDPDLILERRFLCRLLREAILCPEDTGLHHLAHAYIAWQAMIWRELVHARHDEVGFGRFHQRHGHPLRSAGNGHIIRRLIQAQRTGHVRQSTWRVTSKHLLSVAREIDAWENGTKAPATIPRPIMSSSPFRYTQSQTKQHPQKLIAHWIRKPSFSERERDRAKGLQYLRYFLRSQHGWRLEGIDIANSEFHGWVGEYTPMFRHIRYVLPFDSGEIPRPFLRACAPLHHLVFTPHAGEDYYHPLSGMRAMDETLRFLDLRAGDRIGHGLAMGIDPSLWFARVGREVAMPRGEWLDNLVWFRRQLLQIPEHAYLVHQLEKEIHIHAKETYGTPLQIQDLEHAWELRRYPLHLARWTPATSPLPRLNLGPLPWPEPHWEKNEDARRLWQEDVLAFRWKKPSLRTHRVPVSRAVQKRKEIIQTFTPSEWDEAIRAVQTRWIEEVTNKGIMLEVNPTSNLCISVLQSMEEHPVFRWSPPDEKPKARIVIGSDDPGVFATELAFEYACLLAVARKQGIKYPDLERWITSFHDAAKTL